MTVLNANEIGYYDLNKKIVECDDNDITTVSYTHLTLPTNSRV